MSTFITRLDEGGDGPRVAVKDIIDVAGTPTTAGSRAVERRASPAERDAACLAGLRAAGARLVGKANLHELAMLPNGINPWFGTPRNPLDPDLIPGGSSSGSAVAVADGDADVALGSDTGGSIRVPAACCGVVGLKTTFGRVSLDGVWPLAPSFDTIGPIGRDVAAAALGMRLLEPGFAVADAPAGLIGRVRTNGRPEIEVVVDEALARSELEVVDVEVPGLDQAAADWAHVFFTELWAVDHHLADEDPEGLGADVRASLALIDLFRDGAADARARLDAWRPLVAELFGRVGLLALPTLPVFPYRLDEIGDDPTLSSIELTRHTVAFNASGSPCLALPVPVAGSRVPASLQLVGPHGGEDLLLATGAVVESALR